MTADLVISMKEKSFEFSAEWTCADIENRIKIGKFGDLRITASDEADVDAGAEIKLILSPKSIAAFLFQSILLYPIEMAAELSQRRDCLRNLLPRALRQALSGDCSWSNAWKNDGPMFDWADLEVLLAEQHYLGRFQHCGQFIIDKLHWKSLNRE
jgi:hypothetical protein